MLGPFLLLIAGVVVLGQTTDLSLLITPPCKEGEFFDTASLSCQSCAVDKGYLVSPDGLSCLVCDSTNGTGIIRKGADSYPIEWTPARVLNGRCICAPSEQSSLVMPVHFNGTLTEKCVSCPNDTSLGMCKLGASVVDEVPLADLINDLKAQGAIVSLQTAFQATIQDVALPGGSSQAQVVQDSLALTQWLGPSASLCYLEKFREGCQGLANLCVLQMYSSDAVACQLYQELVDWHTGTATTASSRKSTSTSPKPDTGPLPWLYYEGTGYLMDNGVQRRFNFHNKAEPLHFVLATYSLNGTWLGFTNLTGSLQLCGADYREASAWTHFGVNYENSCVMDVQDIMNQVRLQFSSGPLFFDLFLQDGGTLYPVPIKVLNKVDVAYAGVDSRSSGHVRRFFSLDILLGSTRDTTSGKASILQYPQEIHLQIQTRQDQRSKIYPPVMTIRYGAVPSSLDFSVQTSFKVTYRNDPTLQSRFWSVWQTMLVVFLVVVSCPLWILQMMAFMRRHASQVVDLEFLVHGSVMACDLLSLGLVIVLVLVSLYWLILVKLQEEVHMLMLLNDDMYRFWVTVVLAIVGQSVGLAHMIWKQLSVDIFFIDWEKPRKILARGGGKEESAPVSAWRTLMVANEWNELQVKRGTYPALTLMLMVFILEGCNMISAANMNPDEKDYYHYHHLQQNMILRFGITAAWFLLLGLAQLMLRYLLYHQLVCNPLSQYVDLMFLADISLVILDSKTSGYYLHGRNQMQHSDTSLGDINTSLLKEEQGLVTNRGLVTTYQSDPALNDQQVFTIYIPDDLRKKYEASLLSRVEQAARDQRNSSGMLRSSLHGPKRAGDSLITAKEDITETFKMMVDEVERNHATQVLVPTYWQSLLRLPPEGATRHPVFMHDFHKQFSSVLFYGNESRLYIYEALFFCAVDMTLRNVPISAFITYLMVKVVALVRVHFGENNLSSKTLVDRRFLI